MFKNFARKILLSFTIVFLGLFSILLSQVIGLVPKLRFSGDVVMYAFLYSLLMCSFWLYLIGEFLSMFTIFKNSTLYKKRNFIFLAIILLVLGLTSRFITDEFKIVVIMYLALIVYTAISIILYCKFRLTKSL